MGMAGRMDLNSDTNLSTGQALVASATGWAVQAISGGRVDAIATHDSLTGKTQAAKLLNSGGVVPALAGEALTIGERVMVTVTTGRFISWAAGGEIAGWVKTAAAANGDMFELVVGSGSVPTAA